MTPDEQRRRLRQLRLRGFITDCVIAAIIVTLLAYMFFSAIRGGG